MQKQHRIWMWFLVLILGSGLSLTQGVESLQGQEPTTTGGATPEPQTTLGDSEPHLIPAQLDVYLANPGIGWQEAVTLNDPILPETVMFRRPVYSWAAQNPAEGVFDWARLDIDLQTARSTGKQHSFRIYTMQGAPYGGHKVPQWVLEKGAVILSSGEPLYSNCVYQEYWAQFVQAMRARYDGNTTIAFIDISGYGNFNEWSWSDPQTTWEDGTVDAQARQRLADMFIGGTGTIQCHEPNGQLKTVSYSYPGFQQTQLVMPYGGIQKSTRYVASRRADVGIRHDCLGSAFHTDGMMERIGDVIAATWPQAPIVFEFCHGTTADATFIANADDILKRTHGSVVHDNLSEPRSATILADLLKYVGYRYTLNTVTHSRSVRPGGPFNVQMTWANEGYAPVYPKMGQDFKLHFYLVDQAGYAWHNWLVNTNVAHWMPADPLPGTPPSQIITETFQLTNTLPVGLYTASVAIIDKRTGQSIQLPMVGRDTQGRYPVGSVSVSVVCRSDVNADGVVNGIDVQLVAFYFHKGRYDVVGSDGRVTVDDVMLVSSEFGKRCS